MIFQKPISSLPFKQWLWQDKETNLLLKFSVIAMVLSFTWLKILYPFPNFMPPDSYSYLEAAYNNEFINIWAIGYSKFLRLVSSFSNSHFALVALQYLLLQVSLLYFLFTIRYLLAPYKWTFRVLLTVSVLNPLLPHICNFVSSDAVFTALSLGWFTQLLWIIYQPNKKLIYVHAITLVLAFMVRYNALYYPFISIVIIGLAHLTKGTKYIGIGFIIVLLCSFIGVTRYEYYTKTGTIQFSAFGGWQMAANALYGYAYAKTDASKNVPAKFRKLHMLVNQHMDSMRHLTVRPDNEVAIYYLWDFKSPLRIYMANQWSNDSSTIFFERWAKMAPLYKDYGRYLIEKHPWPFIKYYVWPNFIKYYAPPTKFMGVYNLGEETVDPIAVTWFGWKNNKLPTFFKVKKVQITEIFTIVTAVVNLVFVLSFLAFTGLSGFNECSHYGKRILLWMLVIWLGNMVFSVIAAPIELRYQLFALVITIGFTWLLITYVVEKSLLKAPAINQYHQQNSTSSETLIQ